MLRLHRSFALAVVCLLLAACGEPSTAPPLETLAQFAKVAKANGLACSGPFDAVITNEAELFAAMAGASPGDVIGVDGTIELATGNAFVTTPGVTLTCASPGSGFEVQPGMPFNYAVVVHAPDVTVSHLVVDVTDALAGALRAHFNGANALAARVEMSHNAVTCGPTTCLFFTGVEDAAIADNDFASPNGEAGIHLQGQGPRDANGIQLNQIDGSRVERNVVTAAAAFTSDCTSFLGGIRVRDGSNVVVAHNTVSGPWQNSLSPADISESSFEKNSFEGAECYGMALSRNRLTVPSVRDIVVRNNRSTGAAITGLLVANGACGNAFFGNNLQGNAHDMGAIFTFDSGDNTLGRQPERRNRQR